MNLGIMFCVDIINSDLAERQGRPVQAYMVILIDTFEMQNVFVET